jgi:hypothetical protein
MFAVQGGFVAFFSYRMRAKCIADSIDAEWSELQGSPKTS